MTQYGVDFIFFACDQKAFNWLLLNIDVACVWLSVSVSATGDWAMKRHKIKASCTHTPAFIFFLIICQEEEGEKKMGIEVKRHIWRECRTKIVRFVRRSVQKHIILVLDRIDRVRKRREESEWLRFHEWQLNWLDFSF